MYCQPLAPAQAAELADQITGIDDAATANDVKILRAVSEDKAIDASVRRYAHVKLGAVRARLKGNTEAARQADLLASRIAPAQW